MYDTGLLGHYGILGVQLVLVVLKCFICKDPLNSESVQMDHGSIGSICTLSELQSYLLWFIQG